MSKPRRRALADLLGREDDVADNVTSSRDDVITLPEEPVELEPSAKPMPAESPASPKAPAKAPAKIAKEPRELRRNSYHASLYLPAEAQFALREIALTMRRPKPHDVMLEAMAELFEKYNKGKLARECRARITSKT